MTKRETELKLELPGQKVKIPHHDLINWTGGDFTQYITESGGFDDKKVIYEMKRSRGMIRR